MTPVGRAWGITIDVSDLDRAGDFWGALLGVETRRRQPPYLWFDPDAAGLQLILQQVPEVKQSKNRLHLEIASPAPDALIQAVQDRGGARLAEVDENEYSLTVMADPDGNEFCVTRRGSPSFQAEMP